MTANIKNCSICEKEFSIDEDNEIYTMMDKGNENAELQGHPYRAAIMCDECSINILKVKNE